MDDDDDHDDDDRRTDDAMTRRSDRERFDRGDGGRWEMAGDGGKSKTLLTRGGSGGSELAGN